MTPVYEVRTKHTEQVLKDFISFKEAERNAHITFRIVMLGICDVTLAYLGKGSALTYIFGILAVLTFAFALARKLSAYAGWLRQTRIIRTRARYTLSLERANFG